MSKRLSGENVRKIMLANAEVLVSEQYRAPADELHGKRKTDKNKKGP